MKKPYFTCDTQAPTDSWFADRMLSKKFEYFAHFDVYLNHRGIRQDNVGMHIQMGMHEQQRKNSTQIIQLSKEEMRTHEAMMTAKLADAEKIAQKVAIEQQPFFEKQGGSLPKPITGVK